MTRLRDNWVNAPETQAVFDAIEAGGHTAYFVGGCVRNALMDLLVADIDLATAALPTDVVRFVEAAGLKAVATGMDHGTITVVSDKVPHEVTTFRRDVATDGRRATVAYSTEMEEDAHRRDFTMNALYADRTGQVFDPLNGMVDLHARRVQFIDSAADRITEDHLRSLRFFRFHAWYGDPAGGLDAEALAAIADNLEGLKSLSRERVGAEMLKLLAAPDPAPSIAAMAASGVLTTLLPGADAEALLLLVHFEQSLDVAPEAQRRLAALGGEEIDERLRLSKAQRRDLETLRGEIGTVAGAGELGYRHGAAIAVSIILLRAALFETEPPVGTITLAELGAAQEFPISAEDLMPEFTGPKLGARLKHLEARWIASDFKLSRDDLLG